MGVEKLPSVYTKLTPAQQEALTKTATEMLEDSRPTADQICDSWPDLLKAIDDGFPSSYDEWVAIPDDEPRNTAARWVFRGQARSSWPLASSLDRFKADFDDFLITERLLRDFRAKAGIYNSRIPNADDKLEWLALMQHHGNLGTEQTLGTWGQSRR